MRTTAAVLTSSLLAAAALFTVGASGASATGTPGCASQPEFSQIQIGMTRAHVAQVFAIDGKQTLITHSGGHTYTVRQYKPCPPSSYVSVSYRDDIVTSKTGHFG